MCKQTTANKANKTDNCKQTTANKHKQTTANKQLQAGKLSANRQTK